MTKFIAGPEFDSLPPLDVRLINPAVDKIDTPVDDRNLVDVPRLIEAVQETINPDYLWPRSLSVHHFYWPDAAYPNIQACEIVNNPAVFRNLPLHKGLVPRVFENWLHIVTLPPPKPDPEVMEYRVEAWKVAKSLFESVQKTLQWEKMAKRRRLLLSQNPYILGTEFDGQDTIGEEIIHEVLERHFRGTAFQMARLERIPPEFRLFDPSQPTRSLMTQLGRLVSHGQLKPQIPIDRTEIAA